MYKYFFFDLDGTLIDSYQHTTTCFIKAIKKYRGIDLNFQEVFQHFKIAFGDVYDFYKPSKEEWSYFGKLHNDIYEKPIATLYPEIPNLLKTIKDNGGTIFLYTNRNALSLKYLEFFKIDSFFSGAIYDDGTIKYKPDPEPLLNFINTRKLNVKECVVIGDRAIDVEAAYKANIDSILFDEYSSVFFHHATHVIKRLNEIYLYLDLKHHLIANYHTHTIRCGHAIGSDEDFINTAIASGLETLGFSDHYLVNNQASMEEYVSTLSLLREKYKNRIDIKIGFETEYRPDIFPKFKKMLDKAEIDYLILGNHFYLSEDGKETSFFDNVNPSIGFKKYYENLKKAFQSGMFSILAHPDLYLRGYRKWDEKAIKLAHKIGALCEKYDIIVEVNPSGFRGSISIEYNGKNYPPYPFIEFFRILKNYNLKFIIGADAHRPESLCDDAILKAYELIDELGLNLISKMEV